MNWYITAVYSIGAIYMLLNFKRDIHAFQLNSYRRKRYYRWLTEGHIFDAWHLTDMALFFLMLSTLLTPAINAMAVSLVMLFKIGKILTARYKKPLVFTKRVWRLYTATGIMALAATSAMAIWGGEMNAWGVDVGYSAQLPLSFLLLCTTFSWLFVMAASRALDPVEKHINARYYADARRILESMPDLKVVGITGSFGKTSTKHYLYRILSEQFDTLMTPGSYNTPMGVIRTIREQMKPYNQIFICEMGAKQTGDIKEICDLVNPCCGIITAVGEMHLETFGSIDNVQATKFELADAIPSAGFVVINNDFPKCADRAVANTRAIRYAVTSTEGADYTARDIEYSPEGTHFRIEGPDGLEMNLFTHLVGECNISNLLAAVVVALQLGMDPERIRYAVECIEQVEHRLSMKRTPGGVTIIDDAFNSNPHGSRMALEVLGRFSAGRRIVVTPGMIELGDRQEELNSQLGEHIADNVDIAIVVGLYNRDAILSGIRSRGTLEEKNIIAADSFAQAQTILSGMLKPGDTVLYENDLPDTFK